MDCCGRCNCLGHIFTRRQWMWGTVAASVGTMLAGGTGMLGTTAAALTAEDTTAALDVLRALSAADLASAHAAGQPAIISDVEGLDFLEGKLERLEQAHQRGVRHVQLVHYTPNDIGDFQTGTMTHKGLRHSAPTSYAPVTD